MSDVCLNCGGMIAESGKAYGYVGKICHCIHAPQFCRPASKERDQFSEVLGSLPEIKHFQKCSKCGSIDWTGAKMTEDNRVVVECNKCPGQLEDWSPLR